MRRLLLALLAALLVGSALAEDSATEPIAVPEAASSFGVTLTCSARLPTGVTGCFLERPVLALGALGVSLGVDAQVSFSDTTRGHLAPYALISWAAPAWFAWAEFRLPELGDVPVLGDPDWLRVGISITL